MTFGLKVINDSSYVQIDSDTPRLCALYSGTYQASGSETATITFPQPITTVEPPCIFIRNSPSQASVYYRETKLNGSAGNWTGFRVRAGNVTQRPSGKWFVAVFASMSKATYGLRMWDSSGTIIYDSGATPVIFTKAGNTWSYGGGTSTGAAYIFYYNSGVRGDLLEDEYFMINPFSRGLLAPNTQNWNWFGVKFDYANSRLQGYSVGFDSWADIGDLAAVYARLPGT